MTTILIVEDDLPILQMLQTFLKTQQYTVLTADTGVKALDLLATQTPDLVLLDWMLPDIDGVRLIKSIRKLIDFQTLPIIMLTAKSSENDKVTGLDSGADDYMTKPVLLKELAARIHSLLRRVQGATFADRLTVGKIVITPAKQQLLINNISVNIATTEFLLLHFLMKNKERIFERSQLLDAVWGQLAVVDERTVDVYILRLRKILKPHQAETHIQTIRNRGYKFNPHPVQ